MLSSVLLSFVATVFDAAPWMVIGFLIAGFVNVFVSKDALLRCLGGRGLWPMIRSILVGLGLPICSCGVVPIAIGLHRKGAPVGSTLAFLIAAPAMSPAAAFTMWMLLGPKLAAAYLVSVAVTALAVGLVANVLFPTPDAPVGSSHERSLCTPAPAREPVIIARFDRHNLGRMLRYAFHDYGAEVSFDILFGLLLATVVVGMLPADWIGRHLGVSDPLTYLVVAAIASPIYVCTLPSIPVVRNLIAVGMVPGAAVTYLIGGTASNYGEIRALSRQMSRPVALYFLGAVMTSAFVSGLLIDRHLFDIAAGSGAYGAMGRYLPVLMRPEAEGFAGLSVLSWLWGGAGSIALGYVLVMGGRSHALRVWNNPCQVCGFWAKSFNVKSFRACAQPCWVVRTVRALHGLTALVRGARVRLPEVAALSSSPPNRRETAQLRPR